MCVYACVQAYTEVYVTQTEKRVNLSLEKGSWVFESKSGDNSTTD